MSERLETVVVVTDRGSQTFTKVGDSATKMGTSIDKATVTSSKGLTNLSKAGAAAGAAFATLGGVLSTASRANAEAEASQARLNTAIEDSGHFLSEYQDAIDGASKKALQLGFDDEDAADSIAKLTTATGDANKAISDLAIAEDIARARKIDLASATQIVIAAEQGRVGALARIGIQVDKNSTAEERLDALRSQFAGNAEAYAATEAGARDRVTNSIENHFEALGHLLGPTQQYIALLPGLQAGYVGVGAAIGALAPELEAATVASAALDVALGPVGIALGAVAAGVAIYELYQHLNDLTPAEQASKQAADDLTAALKAQVEAGSLLAPLTKDVGDSLKYIDDASTTYNDHLKELTGTVDTLKGSQTQFVEGSKGYEQIQKEIDGAQKKVDEYTAAYGRNGVAVGETAKAQRDALEIINDTGLAGDLARDTLQKLYDAEQAGTLVTHEGQTQWQAYVARIIDLHDHLPEMNLAMAESAKATEGTTAATKKGSDANKEAINAFTGYRMGIKQLGDQFQTLDGQTQSVATAHASLGDAIAKGNEMFAAEQAAAKQATDEFIKQAAAVGGLDTELEQLIAANVSTWAERTANRVLQSTQGLGSLMNVIIDGTKNLGSQSQNLNDWAVGLINVAGSYGKIDDLLAHGQITQTTYNQAQEAGTRIIADNAAVQEDLLRIQAKQAPILADAADAQAKYVDQLADMPAQQQEVALGWMDQNEAAKANAALNLAAAAAAGEYGAAGEEAATKAITAQAQADPAFAAMLTDMGVISQGANGEIVVNFPTASQVHDDTVNLTASIDALTVALGGVPPVVSTTITANDAASGVIQSVQAQLNALNGQYANATIYVGVSGPGVGYQLPRQLGGPVPQSVIPHAQTGMLAGDSTVVRMNEAGGELVRLPNGSLVYPHGASMEMVRNASRGGGNIVINGGLTVVANNPREFADNLRAATYAQSRG